MKFVQNPQGIGLIVYDGLANEAWMNKTIFVNQNRPSKCLKHQKQRLCKILWAGVNLLL